MYKTKVTVSVGRTVNIGNYEIVAEVTLEGSSEYPEGFTDEQITEIRKELNIQACKELDAAINNLGKLYRS
jgi:hypothetical protein